jgi:hypothetical protein
MDVVWGRFQAAYPRKGGCTVMDDDAGKLHQPLMASGGEEDSDDNQDAELGGLLPREDVRPVLDEGSAARRKRRRRKEDEDLGEVTRGFSVSVEPLQMLRSMGRWVVSLSAAGSLLAPRSSPKSTLPVSLSTQMLSRRHKPENMDEVSERALALLALITLGFCFLLLLVVYVQAA